MQKTPFQNRRTPSQLKKQRSSRRVKLQTLSIKRKLASLLTQQLSHYVVRDIQCNKFACPRTSILTNKKDLSSWNDSISISSTEDVCPRYQQAVLISCPQKSLPFSRLPFSELLKKSGPFFRELFAKVLEFEVECSRNESCFAISQDLFSQIKSSNRKLLQKVAAQIKGAKDKPKRPQLDITVACVLFLSAKDIGIEEQVSLHLITQVSRWETLTVQKMRACKIFSLMEGQNKEKRSSGLNEDSK